VLIDDDAQVVYVYGRTGRFLEPASGAEPRDLLAMARAGLRHCLAELLDKAAPDQTDPVSATVEVAVNGGSEWVTVTVHHLSSDRVLRGMRLVTFTPAVAAETGQVEAADGRAITAGMAASDERGSSENVSRLERRLVAAEQDNRMNLQELQGSNEELQSINEELQSSNEELEVSKEEVESLNEELRSVNAELEAKVEALSNTNDDLKNLLESTDIAVLFLHEDMRIKGFTEAARALIAARDGDIGRPFDELATNLADARLTDHAQAVLADLAPHEVDVSSRDGDWYRLRLMPYRTTENAISGVVCTFQSIARTASPHHAEPGWRELVSTAREPMMVVTGDVCLALANDRFAAELGLRRVDLEGGDLFEVGNGCLNQPEIRTLIVDILPARGKVEDFPLELVLAGEEVAFRVNACRCRPREPDSVVTLLSLSRQ
jgi:two-component system CheB/CheR fusion protein